MSATQKGPLGISRTTPFPNHLIDTVMPILSDTEWRLLCVVVRQTLGWQSKEGRDGDNRRKERDWLTHSQLQSRTGRASEALSRAVNSLVTKGLIEVCDDRGNGLKTAAARRRCAGRLFYRLGLEAQEIISASVPPESEMPFSESSIRKAKTTKENATKNSPGGEERIDPRSLAFENPSNKEPQPDRPLPDVHRFLRAYRDGFRRHTPHGEPPVIDWGKDGKVAKQLLRLYTHKRLAGLLERYFAMDDEWVRRHGYSLYAFKASIGGMLVREGATQNKLRDAIKNPVTIHTPGWKRAEEKAKRDDLRERP